MMTDVSYLENRAIEYIFEALADRQADSGNHEGHLRRAIQCLVLAILKGRE